MFDKKPLRIICFDQNVWGEFADPTRRETVIHLNKIICFANLQYSNPHVQIVYTLMNLMETEQIQGPKRDYLIRKHLDCIERITHGKLLVYTDKECTISRDFMSPAEMLKEWQRVKQNILEIVKKELINASNPNEQQPWKLLKDCNGDCIKAAMLKKSKSVLDNRDLLKQEIPHFNNLKLKEVFKAVKNHLMRCDTKGPIDIEIIKYIKKLEKIASQKNNSGKDLAKLALGLDMIGYKSISRSKLRKKPCSIFFDAVNLAYVLKTINIFVTEDKKLRERISSLVEHECLITDIQGFVKWLDEQKVRSNNRVMPFIEYFLLRQ